MHALHRTFCHPEPLLAGIIAIFVDGLFVSLVVASHYALYCDTSKAGSCFERKTPTGAMNYRLQAMFGFYVNGIFVLMSTMVTGLFFRPYCYHSADSSFTIENSQSHVVLEKFVIVTISSIGFISNFSAIVVNACTIIGCTLLLVHLMSGVHCSHNLMRVLKVWSYLSGLVFGLLGVVSELVALTASLANIFALVGIVICALLMVFCCTQVFCLKPKRSVAPAS